jgi:S-adenosylmethionine:diacylglycerol 3-amino-3-carboxypropyl transferase
MTKKSKLFDAVEFMRQQRDLLSEKLSKMTKEEVIAYFNQRDSVSTIKPSA